MVLMCNCNWFWGSFFIVVVTADLQNMGRGKNSSSVKFSVGKRPLGMPRFR
jgi:hypothetical protein